MKTIIRDFFGRGLLVCGFGPLVLAVIYLILHSSGVIVTLSVGEVCTGIFSLSALAFLAGGLNVLYQIERLPMMLAIFIHGWVLYLGYLVTYLINGWLARGLIPLLVFSGIFVFGYLAIWAVIYIVAHKRTKRLNAILEQKQLQETE